METLTLYRLDCDYDYAWRLRDAIRENDDGYPTHYRRKESAFDAARAIVTQAADELRTSTPDIRGGEVSHEHHEAYRWVQSNRGKHWHQVEVTSTPTNVRVEEDDHSVSIVWGRSEVVRLTKMEPREIVIEGVKYKADPVKVVLAESPPFVVAKDEYKWTGSALVPTEDRQTIYVKTVSMAVMP